MQFSLFHFAFKFHCSFSFNNQNGFDAAAEIHASLKSDCVIEIHPRRRAYTTNFKDVDLIFNVENLQCIGQVIDFEAKQKGLEGEKPNELKKAVDKIAQCKKLDYFQERMYVVAV